MPKGTTSELISQIFSVSRLIRESAKDREKIDPFSYLRLEALRYVSERKNPSMKDISDYLCITPPSATSLVNGLVKAKHLERLYDKDDRRIVRLAITQSGKKKLEAGFRDITKRMEKILSNLEEKERRDLIRILQKLHRVYNK